MKSLFYFGYNYYEKSEHLLHINAWYLITCAGYKSVPLFYMGDKDKKYYKLIEMKAIKKKRYCKAIGKAF